ncbi:NTP transferase domain-containing protein [Alteromonas sp. 1_MG-2023]|uniref:molybdenum cofactor guanylyltransferase n=1 Tax=Alteromonas sp. 1_MG-2023 TaxID=3062669 RepID=UPI0026E33941|nr:NTP transferase domain-containing protein [Alteromonas sp. 1_MG-2023]MDO6567603.1 NTP transferase domain-containing protein [Alteromonas sp. 1_MG-2023]
MVVDGVVLAGGLSSRMMQDKALLYRDKRDMLTFTIELISTLPINELFVSRNDGVGDDASAYQLVSDEVANIGPLGGIYSVVKRSTADALIITPVDLPLLLHDDLLKLVDEGRESQTPVYYAHHYLPLFLPITPQLRHYLEDVAFERIPQRSVHALCSKFNAKQILPSDKERLTNANTPAQWNAVKKLID